MQKKKLVSSNVGIKVIGRLPTRPARLKLAQMPLDLGGTSPSFVSSPDKTWQDRGNNLCARNLRLTHVPVKMF